MAYRDFCVPGFKIVEKYSNLFALAGAQSCWLTAVSVITLFECCLNVVRMMP